MLKMTTPFPIKRNVLRMLHWLIIAALFYFVAYCLSIDEELRQLSTISWKLGNVTVGGYVGYWLDRHLFQTRIDDTSPPLLQIRRAVIVAASIFAVSTGL
jgi:hypothetical protein